MNTETLERGGEQPSLGRILFALTRPHTLTASFVPVLVGTAVAFNDGYFHIGLFLAMLFACLSLQIATNLFNEYYDFKRGLDTADSVGIGGAIVRNGMNPKTVLYMALGFYALALAIGIYICANSSWWLALVGIAGMAVGYLYTGGPFPIAYTPFGELFAGLFMGSLFIIISYFIQTGMVNVSIVLISIPIAILVGNINLANNIRDIEEDTKGGRKTLAILIGHKKAVIFLAVCFAAAYLWVAGLVLWNEASPWIFLVILSIPIAVKAVQSFAHDHIPGKTVMAMKSTAKTNTIFGFLLFAGLFIGHYL